MGGLLRKLAIYLCAPIYKLIPQIYNIYYVLANHQFFEEETISQISNNIYVLVSVVMLFAFSANLLAAIVNPDLLNDKNKGIGAIFKRSIIGLILIVVIPFAFNYAYDIQETIMSNSIIEKVITGVNYTDSEGNNNPGGNGGQVIAGTLIGSILYPDVVEDGAVDTSGEHHSSHHVSSQQHGNGSVTVTTTNAELSECYTNMIAEDIKNIDCVKKDINVTKDSNGSSESYFTDTDNYAFKFDGLIAIIAGLVCCYLLITFAIDIAVRMVKLAFLQLTSPVSIVAYICVGGDMFKRWYKEALSTYVDVFIRAACMGFYIFLMGNLDGFLTRLSESSEGIANFGLIDNLFLKIFLIVGLLIFVKQIPDMVNRVFGTNMQSKGGIEGRLGQMAIGGKIAQQAWRATRNAGLIGMGAAGLLPAAALGAVGTAAGAAVGGFVGQEKGTGFRERFQASLNSVKNAPKNFVKTGKKIGSVAGSVGATVNAFANGNPINAIPNAVKTFKGTELGQYMKSKTNNENKNDMKEEMGIDEYNNFIPSKEKPQAEESKVTTATASREYLEKKYASSNLSKEQIDARTELLKVSDNKALVDKLKDQKSSATSYIEGLQSSLTLTTSQSESLNKAKNEILKGDLVGAYNTVSGLFGQNSSYVEDFSKKLEMLDRTSFNALQDNNFTEFLATQDVNATSKDVISSVLPLSFATSALVENKKQVKEYTMSNATELQKNTDSEFQAVETIRESAYLNAMTQEKSGYNAAWKTEETKSTKVDATSQPTNVKPMGNGNYQTSSGIVIPGSSVNASASVNNAQPAANIGSQPQTGIGSGTTVINNNYGTNPGVAQSDPNMQSYFDGLSKDIKDASKSTNDILSEQLKEQKIIKEQSIKQTGTLNNIKEGVDKVSSNVENLRKNVNTGKFNSDDDFNQE